MEDPLYDFKTPSKFGRGCWYAMLTMAAHANTPEQLLVVCEQVKVIYKSLKCLTCRQHAAEYLATNSIDKACANGALFEYLVAHMSNINVGLRKPAYNLGIMRNIFYNEDSAVCSSNCEEIGNIGGISNALPGVFVSKVKGTGGITSLSPYYK